MDDIHPVRKLAAILLADVVGYSRLMSLDEEGTHGRLARYLKEIIGPTVRQHRGRMLRNMGDGLLVEFDSAVDAVRAGVEVQLSMAVCDLDVAADRRIRLRIGINTGDVIVDERDIYGTSVNIAARLEALAGPGEVYVTQGVYDQVRGYAEFSFVYRGAHRLRNIGYPVPVFRVDYRGTSRTRTSLNGLLAARFGRLAAAIGGRRRPAAIAIAAAAALALLGIAATPLWRDAPDRPPRSSIVILPFSNLSGNAKDDYLANAITDDLTTDVSRLPGTFVIARATAFTYKGLAVDARQVGRECNVRYLLEGSIRREGTRVQVNAQLIDSATGAHLWADRFENEIADVLDLQEAVTGRIASSLDIQLVRAENRRSGAPPAGAAAIELRFRAMGLYIDGVTPEHTLAARGLLEEAVRLDPQSAEAWAWLADLLASDYLNRWNNAGPEQLRQAEDAVGRALALDNSLALAHFVAGYVYRAKGQNREALDSFTLAIKLNPNFSRAYAQKGAELINNGRPKEALPLVDKAVQLSPRDPSIGVFYWILGRAHFFAEQYPDAIKWLERSVVARPNLWYNRLYLVGAYILNNDKPAAAKALEEFNGRFTNPRFTLATVKSYERANPNSNPVMVRGRERFHQALIEAGMAAE
jgi:TolB-like protein/class 3 adenylate cyclase/Tfp pilus assembly protein PilF